MELATQDEKKLDQFATYLAHGVGATDAGSAVGYSLLRVQQLLEDESFLERVAAKKEELIDQFVDVNKNYNRIEQIASANLLRTLQINQDPDLALKAMAVVSKANRRPMVHKPETISQPGEGKSVVVNLSLNLVKAIQNNKVDLTQTVIDPKHAEHNTATPAMLAELLDAAAQLRPELEQVKAMPDTLSAGIMPDSVPRGKIGVGRDAKRGLMNFAAPMDVGDANIDGGGRPRNDRNDDPLNLGKIS